MSLLFVTTWIRYINKKYTPWNDECARCENDPRWTCCWALRKFYNDPEEVIPPYMLERNSIMLRNRHRSRSDNEWQCTELDSVNDRIRIYK